MSGQELVDELRRGDGNGCKHANDTMRRAADRIKALEARERGLVDQVNMFQMGNDRADERDAYAAVIAEARGVLRRASQGDQATRDAGMGRVICGEPVSYGDGTIMWANKFEVAAYADALMPLVARIQAEAWEQGKSAWERYEMACEDAASSGQGHIVSKPKNPWSEILEGKNNE